MYINFSIAHTCSAIDNDNEALTIILKVLQYVLNISTVCILPGFTTNILALTARRWINGVLHWKMLYNVDLFIANNSIPTHQDSRTNSNVRIDYITSSLAAASLQRLKSFSEQWFFLRTFSHFLNLKTNINKFIWLLIRVKLTTKLIGILATLFFVNNYLFFRTKFQA